MPEMEFNFSNGGLLNIAAWAIVPESLGPGKRLCVWTQGCLKNCPGCISPQWRSLKKAMLMAPRDFANYCLDLEYDGITISGGEPFLQHEALAEFIDRAARGATICFTGLKLEEIRDKYKFLLQKIDILIDGEFQISSMASKGLRGSSNQRILPLNTASEALAAHLLNWEKSLTLTLTAAGPVLAGIPDKRTLCVIERWQKEQKSFSKTV